jgi:hypothetical protein
VAHLGHGVMGAPVRAEPVRAGQEIGFEDWLEHQLQSGLNHPVADGGDSQPPLLQSPRLGDHPFPHGQRAEAARLKFSTQPGDEILNAHLVIDMPGSHPVDPGGPGAPVAPDAIPRHPQESGIAYKAEQIVKPAARVLPRPLVQLGLDLQYPSLGLPEGRVALQIAGIHQRHSRHSSLLLAACWLPWPCRRLSRPRTTTEPPPRPAAISWHRACPPLAWKARGMGGRGRFPRSPSADRRGRHPALPRQPRQQLRRGPSPWRPCPETLSGHERGRLITCCARLLRTGPYPPDLSRLTVYRASSLVPRVCLPVLLAGPGPSGSTGPSRRCQGCFPPSPAVPGSGCPQLHPAATTARRRSPLTSTRNR